MDAVQLEERARKARLAQRTEQVEGWLYLDEAWALHETVRTFGSPTDRVTVVEIGSWKGRSTIALASGIEARGGHDAGKVIAIDPHTGTEDGPEIGPASTVDEFRKNIAAAGIEPMVELVVATSHLARARFTPCSVDILFVDGSHHYEDVKTDILDWQPALKDLSVVAFNDPSLPGVYWALRELVVRRSSPFRHPTLIQNTLFFEFRRTQPWTRQDEIAYFKLRTVLRLRFQASRFRRYMPTWMVRTGHALSRRMIGS